MEIEIKFRQHIFTRPPPDPKSFLPCYFFCVHEEKITIQHIISSHFKHAYHQFARLQKVISNHKIIQLAKRDFQHWKRSPHAL
jgi:hypothetical protein